MVTVRGLRVRSLRLGLSGETDVVEFRRTKEGHANSMQIEGRVGQWIPFPVEYKRGRPKSNAADEVQLCAQGLCLEEMFGLTIESGALFYGKSRRRTSVDFDAGLKAQTENLARRMHKLYAIRETPRAAYGKKCDNCSLIEQCMPKMITRRRDVERYLATALHDAEEES